MFSPEVIQVTPHENYMIDIMFHDGKIVKYDAKPLIDKGVFSVLKDKDFFMSRCTVMNRTLAWDLSGEYDPADCLDLDPVTLYSEQ